MLVGKNWTIAKDDYDTAVKIIQRAPVEGNGAQARQE